MPPAFGRDTNQKKETRIALNSTDWSFTDLFFDIIELVILGSWVLIWLDLKVLPHFLSLAASVL